MRTDPRIRKFTEAVLDIAAPVIVKAAEAGRNDAAAGQNMLNLLYGANYQSAKVKPPRLSSEDKLAVSFGPTHKK